MGMVWHSIKTFHGLSIDSSPRKLPIIVPNPLRTLGNFPKEFWKSCRTFVRELTADSTKNLHTSWQELSKLHKILAQPHQGVCKDLTIFEDFRIFFPKVSKGSRSRLNQRRPEHRNCFNVSPKRSSPFIIQNITEIGRDISNKFGAPSEYFLKNGSSLEFARTLEPSPHAASWHLLRIVEVIIGDRPTFTKFVARPRQGFFTKRFQECL